MIKILVNGANGKMGQAACKAIENDKDLDLVSCADSADNLKEAIGASKVDVVVDFTAASVAYQNASIILESGVHPVIGTTGFLGSQIDELQKLAAEKNLGGLIAPNFSISAVLMIKYAQDAVKYLPDVEIIELHHDRKEESPSGTAMQTASLVSKAREKELSTRASRELVPGARGAKCHDIQVHSVRLPGLIAHQEIIFGGDGQSLLLRSDAYNRSSFMPGVLFACKKVLSLDKLYYGLEQILD